MDTPLVDTHCHVDLYPDYGGVIDEAERDQIVTIAVTNTPSVFPKCSELLAGKRFLRPALGLHPQLARERHMELELFRNLADGARFVGEVGLDYVTPDDEERALQRRVFGAVLRKCAEDKRKVLTVHSRRAADDVVDMIGTNYPCAVILHWFSGTRKALSKALDFGFYVSVNPAMVRSESGRSLVAAVPLDRLLTETDGPFVQGKCGRAAKPGDVREVISYLASAHRMDGSELARTIYSTFRSIMKGNGG